MSRVGKKAISIPADVKISYEDRLLTVQGGKGTLTRQIHSAVDLELSADALNIVALQADRSGHAMQGLFRSLVNNMVVGVSEGFERILEINGIGYRASLTGNCIVFNLGYSHPINFDLPDGVAATVDKNNVIRLSGIDKQLLGHTAAAIRKLRPPEPYKGKGVKYAGERIQRKAGKTGTK